MDKSHNNIESHPEPQIIEVIKYVCEKCDDKFDTVSQLTPKI